MNIQKITTYVALALGVLGLVFQIIILGAGDDAIEMDSLAGNFSKVSPMISLAILILGVAVLITVVSSLANLASNAAKLKKALISVAAFLLVVLISFLFSEGVETPMKDGEVLSASGSRWVGAGLRTFYILAVVAVGTMLFSGVKRFLK
jgi:NADH:ubiquinone oxidoreductase subunit 6 (subunit J)